MLHVYLKKEASGAKAAREQMEEEVMTKKRERLKETDLSKIASLHSMIGVK